MPPPVPEPGYTIQAFVNERMCPDGNVIEYKIHWNGCGEEKDTWHSEADLTVGSGGYKARLSKNKFNMFLNRLRQIHTASDSSVSDSDESDASSVEV
jgi:hypothetical protein